MLQCFPEEPNSTNSALLRIVYDQYSASKVCLSRCLIGGRDTMNKIRHYVFVTTTKKSSLLFWKVNGKEYN